MTELWEKVRELEVEYRKLKDEYDELEVSHQALKEIKNDLEAELTRSSTE